MTKILIVEDDRMLSRSYWMILTKEGYEVDVAEDGQEAIKKAEEFRPDLILLDIRMPNMDGIEFLKAYDQPNKHPEIKIIVFSNMEDANQLSEAYNLGANRYMLKSATSPRQLADLIASTLQAQ